LWDLMTRTRLHYTEYQPTEPQFIEPLDTDEYEKETKELLSQVPSQHHEYLDIFRKKGGTETLPPPRPYDMRIDLLPSAKLAVAKLYQLTEDQRMILLDTLKRETEAGRIRPSNAAYGSPMFFVPKKDGRSRMVVDYRRLVQRLQVHHTPLQHPLHRRIPNTHRRQRFEFSYYSDKARSTSYNHVSRHSGRYDHRGWIRVQRRLLDRKRIFAREDASLWRRSRLSRSRIEARIISPNIADNKQPVLISGIVL